MATKRRNRLKESFSWDVTNTAIGELTNICPPDTNQTKADTALLYLYLCSPTLTRPGIYQIIELKVFIISSTYNE